MNIIIRKLEKIRILDFNKKKKKYIQHLNILTGHYLIVWYINREQQKGLIRFQYNKGICMSIKHKGYNSIFQIRTIVNRVVIEQEFFSYSRLNILLLLKRNPLKEYHRNSLKFLRTKKSKKSGYKVL